MSRPLSDPSDESDLSDLSDLSDYLPPTNRKPVDFHGKLPDISPRKAVP